MANAPLQDSRSRLDSFDDSTGPATPYAPNGDSRPALFSDVQPKSGFRTKKTLTKKMAMMLAGAYFLGVLSAAAAFLLFR